MSIKIKTDAAAAAVGRQQISAETAHEVLAEAAVVMQRAATEVGVGATDIGSFARRRAPALAPAPRSVDITALSTLLCSLLLAGSLDDGAAALARYDLERAHELLVRAGGEGPYTLADTIRLQRVLGVTLAYLGREAESLEAFATLLALDPGHALDYTLSPKVLFLFARARDSARRVPPTAVDLVYPRDLHVGDPLDVVIDVLADPRNLLSTAALVWRADDAEPQRIEIELPEPGSHRRRTLPLPEATADQRVALNLVARDARGNEVLEVGTADRPRELLLTWAEPTPWYARWWLWAGVAVLGGAAVYAVTREPPDTASAALDWSYR